MAVKYQTGVATLTQFIVMSALNFVNAITSSVSGCTNGSGCLSNILLSLVYLILIVLWFAFLSALGYAVQDKRSKRFAQTLLAAEALVLLVSLFDVRHYPNILGLLTSLTDAALAAWVILLAWRLIRAKGGRVTAKHRHSKPS